jgi:hypothetical protein
LSTPLAQLILFSSNFFSNNSVIHLSKLYNFQASLNHRANACSCFSEHTHRRPFFSGEKRSSLFSSVVIFDNVVTRARSLAC